MPSLTCEPPLPAKAADPELRAVQEALKAILLVRQAVEAGRTDERLELLQRAETALFESAWQTRRAVGREYGRTL